MAEAIRGIHDEARLHHLHKAAIKFLRYSQRSCSEVQSELYVALDKEYIDSDQFQRLYNLAGTTHSKVGAFIAYLLRSERTH